MSFLIIRAPFIIQQLNPMRPVNAYGTIIHTNSYHLFFHHHRALKYFPMYRKEQKPLAVIMALMMIYGEERTKKFLANKKGDFYIPSHAKINEEMKTDLEMPWFNRLFQRFTQSRSGVGHGAIAVHYPIDESSTNFYADLFNHRFPDSFDFLKHIQEIAKKMTDNQVLKPRPLYISKL